MLQRWWQFYRHSTNFMVRQNKLEVILSRRSEQLQRLLICLIGLLLISDIATAQEVPVPESLKSFPSAKCYWAYSVERLSTTKDSIHNYIIRVTLQQQDSVGNNKGRLKLSHALIYCTYSDTGIPKKINFKQKGFLWIAKFKVSTNQSVPLKIIADYNHQQTKMPLTLNKGTYPGETDNISEEKL
jgi:hypothetical protein